VQKPERRNNCRRGYLGRRANRPKTYYIQSDEKNKKIEKSQCESGRGPRKDQEGNRMGITKYFVQRKSESKWNCERNQTFYLAV
jgi:hypothetical protein